MSLNLFPNPGGRTYLPGAQQLPGTDIRSVTSRSRPVIIGKVSVRENPDELRLMFIASGCLPALRRYQNVAGSCTTRALTGNESVDHLEMMNCLSKSEYSA